MNQTIQHLYDIAQKPERRIIGLMSGTSLDGLDVALCRISNSGPDTQVVIEYFSTVPYDEPLKAAIRGVFAKSQIDFEQLCLLNPYIGRFAWADDSPLSAKLGGGAANSGYSG